MERLKIGLAQFDNVPGDIKQTIEKIEEVAKMARDKKVDFLLFPELFLTGYDFETIFSDVDKYIFDGDEVEIEQLQEIAEKYDLNMLVGMPIKIDENYYVSALQLSKFGDSPKIISKNYLFGDENEYFKSGEEAVVVEMNGFRIGLGICFDAAHDEHIKRLMEQGMDVFIGSSLYGENGLDELRRNHLHISQEFKIPSAVVNFAIETGNWKSCGHSSFYNVDGVLREAGENEEVILTAELVKNGDKCELE
jgi:predicted amidohydrolase